MPSDGRQTGNCTTTHFRMLQGYRQPGLWNQIKDTFHFSKPN